MIICYKIIDEKHNEKVSKLKAVSFKSTLLYEFKPFLLIYCLVIFLLNKIQTIFRIVF